MFGDGFDVGATVMGIAQGFTQQEDVLSKVGFLDGDLGPDALQLTCRNAMPVGAC